MKSYKFNFINGWKPTGKPRIITRVVKADTMKQAEAKLRKRYPRAAFVSLVRK